jgi:tetratricopeptide (TPR) repeat protein
MNAIRKKDTPRKENQPVVAGTMLKDNVLARKRDIILKVIIVVFGFMLYANTLGHGYALDDTVTIWKNEFTQQGFAGIKDILSYDTMAGMFGKDMDEVAGGRYRPLSVVTFAIELEIFGKKTEAPDFSGDIVAAPFVGHFFNVIYYCLLLLLMYHVLKKLFRNHKPRYWFLSIPFLTVMLFAAHPLHTEVVANIKSRDEIMAFIFGLLALDCAIKFLEKRDLTKRILLLVAIFVCIFLGSMSKETTVAFVFLIPLSLYFFYEPKVLDYVKVTIPAFIGALLYVIIRGNVIANQFGGEADLLLNNPFLNMTGGERYATVTYTLLLYLKLLVFPHPLTWDYYPYQIPTMHWTDWQVILSLLLHLGMIVVAIVYLLPKRKSVYSYAIFFYGATLILPSNLLFNVGAFMAERFLFMPSLGFSLAIAYTFAEVLPEKFPEKEKMWRNVTITVLGVAALAFSAKTITRNMDWKDSSTLFAHDVHVSVNSIKGNSSYASDLYTQSEGAEKRAAKCHGADSLACIAQRDSIMRTAIPYFEKALSFDSLNSESLVRIGNIYYKLDNDYNTMFKYYKQALHSNPLNRDVWNNTVGVLTYNIDNPEYEKAIWRDYAELSPNYYESYYQLGEIYYSANPKQNDSVVYYMTKAYSLNTSKFEIPFHLGMAYGNLNDFTKAKEYLLKADAMKEDAEVKKFLGIIYGSEGNPAEAYKYFSKSAQLNPNDPVVQQYAAQSKMEAGL